ncbi:unnamed protein product [Hymenolepis diminuta]|uniref:SHSP domain-containing protein n=1 Tax=Hymenolepis diminuta TaxID=6216 RepID=A0A0R3S881_HYMDI|nr:unnamed protein product [Hymenolepis diminuta]
MKLSSSKSGRLTRQENVVSNASRQFHDSSTIDPPNLDCLNSKNTYLLRIELPKPMSRLPEIRLEGGGNGNGNKGLIAQMKPQKSCESYDSTASGMSWSSSQSTVAISGGGSGYGNSASVSGNLSYASYEEDEKPITRIPSNPGVMHRSQYSPRIDSNAQSGRHNFSTGYSFEEEHHESSPEDREQNLVSDQADPFYESAFDDQERNGDSKFKSSKKKDENEEPEEIDPVYQLLKSAATQGRMPVKSCTSFDQTDEIVRQPSRLSSGKSHSLRFCPSHT